MRINSMPFLDRIAATPKKPTAKYLEKIFQLQKGPKIVNTIQFDSNTALITISRIGADYQVVVEYFSKTQPMGALAIHEEYKPKMKHIHTDKNETLVSVERTALVDQDGCVIKHQGLDYGLLKETLRGLFNQIEAEEELPEIDEDFEPPMLIHYNDRRLLGVEPDAHQIIFALIKERVHNLLARFF